LTLSPDVACCSCGGEFGVEAMRPHPMLGTPMCEGCLDTYNSGDFSVVDGKEIYCRLCGDGGTLLICDNEGCKHSFCKACVQLNFGNREVARIEHLAGTWSCYVCNPQPLLLLAQVKGFGLFRRALPSRAVARGRLLTEDVSGGREMVQISMVNDVDGEGLPDFTYITEPISKTVASVERHPDFWVCCRCEDNCRNPATCKCAQASGGVLPYSVRGQLADPVLAVYECNMFCHCHKDRCKNRTVSAGVNLRLQVFRTRDRGWGVRCIDNIPAGAFITDYLGEILKESDADARGVKEGDEYLFSLDMWASDCARYVAEKEGVKHLMDAEEEEERKGEDGAWSTDELTGLAKVESIFLEREKWDGLVVDAQDFGNVARFVNHSCEPNLVKQTVYVESQDARMPRMALFASWDIPAMQELTYDYGYRPGMVRDKALDCRCGEKTCRGRLY